jgi:hypothetical protein
MALRVKGVPHGARGWPSSVEKGDEATDDLPQLKPSNAVADVTTCRCRVTPATQWGKEAGGQRSSGCGSCRFRSLEMAHTPRYLGRQEAPASASEE